MWGAHQGHTSMGPLPWSQAHVSSTPPCAKGVYVRKPCTGYAYELASRNINISNHLTQRKLETQSTRSRGATGVIRCAQAQGYSAQLRCTGARHSKARRGLRLLAPSVAIGCRKSQDSRPGRPQPAARTAQTTYPTRLEIAPAGLQRLTQSLDQDLFCHRPQCCPLLA